MNKPPELSPGLHGGVVERVLTLLREPGSANVMVDGPWGVGKTAVLREVLRRLPVADGDSLVLSFSVTDLTADGNPRAALLKRLLLLGGAPRSSVNAGRVVKLLKLLAKPGASLLSNLVPMGGLVSDGLSEVAGFVAETWSAHKEGEDKDRYEDPFARMRADLGDYLGQIAKRAQRQRLLLVFDDMDRLKPDQAVTLLDTVYHFFMTPATLSAPGGAAAAAWPVSTLWAVNGAVLEEFLYKSFQQIPSFKPQAYLEKLFTHRLLLPPVFHPPGRAAVDSMAGRLWRASLGEADAALATLLAEEVNYGSLGNLRLHERLRRECTAYWRDKRPQPAQMVRDARLLTLTTLFPEFRAHVLYYEGRWPGFLNRLNDRYHKPNVELPANPIYRHLDEPDLHTLLMDLDALRWDEARRVFELNDAGMRVLAGEMMRLATEGF